ncbi:hypothetical protein P170DRAFT_430258 [Aspergillus steynii IBT 23096]|uniref:Ams2/SPT21 N-terminal domain-containing protein n=1 Tax=Aspergillus steynii IBT 23096 TaxID=1392250 RepID=A0A2I2FUN1_9EURO|nr:uncharacterized protein P170DRAFT_430258 [Aspergillus steynii IBT 23096]PLB44358.1 hypothetical protein P170DRAFT_430258 [Aspergillus steynii IBT 23096]
MESQDGISVRPMRLKVLYTFDDASKTNCLARWPHLLDIQCAALDEKTHVGVIELKTCIQAIVSASPELVAQLGQDYTVYAYDYSEYETPLVGQGMLSWLLASASPTPNAPAHQSKTMVTGRVCKNVLGLFSKGAQETLEVKLRLVPVPSVMQNEYLDNMQKYREISNNIPRDFDTQSWNSFHRQNSNMLASGRMSSPMDHSGIERFHQLLSEGSTPRDFQMATNGSYRSVSPAQSAVAPMSRVSTPFGQHQSFQQDQQSTQQTDRIQGDMIRPSSSASMRDADFAAHARYASRRGSVQSGYGSCDEHVDSQPRKRAKLYRADGPGKPELNIERQPSSLRVAASTAASVRIHRPTPINPSIAAAQNSNEEPVRPPTPISGANDLPRRSRPPPSLLRESSVQSMNQYTSPYPTSDDQTPAEPPNHSPEESRYQGLFEPSFSMPSSPPVLDCGFPNRSSPVLPPMTTDPDSGFMSGGIEELMDEDMGTPLDDCAPTSKNGTKQKRTVRQGVQAGSPASAPANVETPNDGTLVNVGNPENSAKDATSVLPRAPASVAGSRPSSRASFRQAPKPLAPAPISQSELEQLISAIPASDPVMPSNNNNNLQGQNSQPWNGPMSDIPTAETPAAQPMAAEDRKIRSGAGARRLKQVQARLDKCIRDGQAPPFCENCGVIETPTWRRAWSKEIEGSEQEANELTKDPTVFFWQSLKKDEQDKVIKFKIYKKSLVDADNDFVQVLLCNPCGLWLHKFKCMRPENKWNKSSNNKRKRPPRNRKTGGPLSTNDTATRNRKPESAKVDGSSPGASDASSPNEDPATPRAENGGSKKSGGNDENAQENNDDADELPSKRRRATSLEPRKSSDTSGNRWQEQNAVDALRRAIQSSPARNLEHRSSAALGEKTLTPKPVRRVLFPNSQNEGGPLKALGESVLNSPRRSPRIASRESDKRPQDKENGGSSSNTADLDGLFESPSFDFDLPTSPTPRRRNPRAGVLSEKRLSLPYNSPSSSKSRKDVGSDLSPTKLTAQRLQRIQSSPASSTPRQGRTPKQSRSQMPDMSSLSDDAFGSEAFGGINNMVVDIFSEDASAAHTDSLFAFEASKCPSSSNWVDWLPSDYVSPAGSDEDQNADLISAILSDPGMGKENIDGSQFDIFDYADSNLLDSGFFGSDALNADLMALGVKPKPSTEESADKEQGSSANNA